MQINSSSSSATFGLGEALGRNCRGGELFILSSDLGGGKTTFTKGLAHGLGSIDNVSSPTFMVSKIYKGKNLELRHFDFYRLNEGGMVAQELAEYIGDPKSVIVVEWGDLIHDSLPIKNITVKLQRVSSGEDSRNILIKVHPELKYLVDGIKS